MKVVSVLFLYMLSLVSSKECYWNRQCPNLLYSAKTPYETVRGDIRDQPDPPQCESTNVWSIVRHGNRYPSAYFSTMMKNLAETVQPQIVQAYDAGKSQLCAQDIEALRNWKFNVSIVNYPSHLTPAGTHELYDLGKRLRHRYPRLLGGSSKDYLFKTTKYQRNKASAAAFVHGLTDGVNLNVTIEEPPEDRDLILPNQDCPTYNSAEVQKTLQEELKKYYESAEFLEVQRAVQNRLGISYQLSVVDICELYDLCRFYRTWSPTYQDAWCAVFSDQDLLVLDYRDDISHYYQNGYGFKFSRRFVGPLLQDLREHLQAAVRGEGKKIVTYFSHNFLSMQTYTAFGLFRDGTAIKGDHRDPARQWRSGLIGPFASNTMVVLLRCVESGSETHKVQLFVNEKPTELCPETGCTWDQFYQLLEGFDNNLEFCNQNVSTATPDVTGPMAAAFRRARRR